MATDKLTIKSHQALKGTTRVPGDKSISHRAILFGALAKGITQVRYWLAAGDTEATLASTRQLGVNIERHDEHTLTIHGGELHAPTQPLNFVNAGTGIRLAAGILAGQAFESVLDGTEQLRRRPMKRIIEPLRLMGANIEGADDKAPLTVRPAKLKGIRYPMSVASAQVKSAVLLAGLFAEGVTEVVQPGPARDHTERMLSAMGVKIETEGEVIRLTPPSHLNPMNVNVPSDFSSAAFLMVAGCIVPDSEIVIEGVNLNETRTGLLDVLLEMGADITVSERSMEAGEEVGTLTIRTSQLKGVTVGGETVVRMIDEFPVFMLACLMAEGETIVRDAKELRVKETDRIAVMATELRKMGAIIEEREDGFKIAGKQTLKGAVVHGNDDHRVAMSMSIAGLIAEGETIVIDIKCASDSFPRFPETLQALGADVVLEALS